MCAKSFVRIFIYQLHPIRSIFLIEIRTQRCQQKIFEWIWVSPWDILQTNRVNPKGLVRGTNQNICQSATSSVQKSNNNEQLKSKRALKKKKFDTLWCPRLTDFSVLIKKNMTKSFDDKVKHWSFWNSNIWSRWRRLLSFFRVRVWIFEMQNVKDKNFV